MPEDRERQCECVSRSEVALQPSRVPRATPAPAPDLRSSRRRVRDRLIAAANSPVWASPDPSIEARCSIKLSTPPRLVARVKIFVRAAIAIAATRSTFNLKRKHPAERSSFAASLFRVRDASAVRDSALARHVVFASHSATRRHFLNGPAFAMAAFAFRDGPASNRKVTGPRRQLVSGSSRPVLKRFVRHFRRRSIPTDDVAMAAKVFRGGMHNQIAPRSNGR